MRSPPSRQPPSSAATGHGAMRPSPCRSPNARTAPRRSSASSRPRPCSSRTVCACLRVSSARPARRCGAAEKLGYPVTLKVSSAAIAHKTEAGGVALNLRTPQEVKAAAERMAKLAPDVLVERMVTGAVAELIIGLKADPQFGDSAGRGRRRHPHRAAEGLGHPDPAHVARRDRTGADVAQGLETGRRLPRQVGRPARRHRGGRGGGRLRRRQSRTASRNSTSTPCSCCPTAPSPSMRSSR